MTGPGAAAGPDAEALCEIQRGGAVERLGRGELRRLAVQGRLHPETPLRRLGESRWRPARELVDELLPETRTATGRASAPRPGLRRRPSRLFATALVLAFVLAATALIWLKARGL